MTNRGVKPFALGRDPSGVTTRPGQRKMVDGVNMENGFRDSDRRKYIARQSRLSAQFCSTSNQCWRGASRRPNGTGVNVCPVSGAAPANRSFKLTDACSSRTPDVRRRSSAAA